MRSSQIRDSQVQIADEDKCHDRVKNKNGITFFEWKLSKSTDASCASTTNESPKITSIPKTPLVVGFNEVATPSTCTSSQANLTSYHQKQQLNINIENNSEFGCNEQIVEKPKSCMRNLTKCMSEAEEQVNCKSKSEPNDDSRPTDNLSEGCYEIDFDTDPIPHISLTLNFDDVLPLNQFIADREFGLSFTSNYEGFSPMGDSIMPLSSMY